MKKWLLILFIAVGLVIGSIGVPGAAEHDFETGGSYANPWRIVGFVVFPVGLLLDYALFRPVTYVACSASKVTGCTAEEQRALGIGVDADEDWALEEAVEEDRSR